ncbi:MAG TPA: hypothetical protein VK731_00770 [Candidatus Cybelea sp.]|nr:hypothetical protein [Candidatus Cybelea sp.]
MKNLLCSLVLLVVGLCIGLVIGYHAPPSATPPDKSAPESSAGKTGPLPPVENAAGPAANSGSKKLTVAEIPAAFMTAIKKFSSHGEDAIKDFEESLDPANTPDVLALLDKIPAVQTRQQIRNLLLARWADTNIKSAMAEASAVEGFENRKDAIIAVLTE